MCQFPTNLSIYQLFSVVIGVLTRAGYCFRRPLDRRGASNVLNWSSEVGERRLAWNSTELRSVQDSYTSGKPCTEVFY